MKKIISDEKFNILRIALLILFIVVWTLKRVILFEFLFETHVVHYVFAVLALLLLAIDVITKRRMFSGKSIGLLIGLCVVMIISTIVNAYSIVENISTIIFVGVQFLIFYSIPSGQKKERVKSDSILLSKIFCILFSIFTTIMVISYVANLFYDAIDMETGQVYSQGYNVWLVRTWGIFYYPATVILGVVSIGLICYLFKNKAMSKALGIYIIVIDYLGVVLCGARSVLFSFYVFIFFIVLLCLRKKIYLKILAAILSVGIVIGVTNVVSHFLPLIQKGIFNAISPNTYVHVLNGLENVYRINGYEVKGYFVNFEIDSNTGKKEAKQGFAITRDIERYDLAVKNDYSSSRTSIWKEAIQIIKDSPIVGVSPRGLLDYMKENYPNSLIATMEWPLHNAYLDIPVLTGVLGCICFYGFVFSLLCFFGKYFVKYWKKINVDVLILLPIIVAMCVYLLVESDVFLQYTAQSMMFWFILGIITAFVKFDMEENGETISNS